METAISNSEPKVTEPKIKKTSPKKQLVGKKVDPETNRLLQTIKDKVNKKNFGRSITDSEILIIALKQIQPQHILELQESTFSEKDRLHIAHDDYTKAHGKITLDQFIGKLIRGELKVS